MKLKELFPDFFSKNFPNSYIHLYELYVVNVKAFFEKTRYLLTSKSKNISFNKSRPIIITSVEDGKVQFVALSTYLLKRDPLREIDTSSCKYDKAPDECFGVGYRKHSWLFSKITQNKKIRVRYELDMNTFIKLIDEGVIHLCGKCDKNIFIEVEKVIKNLGEKVI